MARLHDERVEVPTALGKYDPGAERCDTVACIQEQVALAHARTGDYDGCRRNGSELLVLVLILRLAIRLVRALRSLAD